MIQRMGLSGIDHINIDTDCLDATIEFYAGVLGLESRVKPSGNPGVWLYLGESPIVHVNPVDRVDGSDARPSTGLFNHVAFAGSGVAALTSALERAGHDYRLQVRPERGVTQIFTTDPNGIVVELSVTD